LLAGKLNAKVRPGREDLRISTGVVDENGQTIFVTYKDVKKYFTEEFWSYYEIFNVSEILGLWPLSGGWAEWPEGLARAMTVLKLEARILEREKINDERHEAKNGSAASRQGGHDRRIPHAGPRKSAQR